jgi:transposase
MENSINPIEQIWLTIKVRWFDNYVCKNEEKLIERLDQAILDVINKPKKTQKNCLYRNAIMTNALI